MVENTSFWVPKTYWKCLKVSLNTPGLVDPSSREQYLVLATRGDKLTSVETPWPLVRTGQGCHRNPKHKLQLWLPVLHEYIASDTDILWYLCCAETLAANIVTWRPGWKMGDTRGHCAVCKETLRGSTHTFPQLIHSVRYFSPWLNTGHIFQAFMAEVISINGWIGLSFDIHTSVSVFITCRKGGNHPTGCTVQYLMEVCASPCKQLNIHGVFEPANIVNAR